MNGSPAQVQNLSVTSPAQPRLTHYIARTDGSLVPLIPADELPIGMSLVSVPRSLNIDQVFALHRVATLPNSGLHFMLENRSSKPLQPTPVHSDTGPRSTLLSPAPQAIQAVSAVLESTSDSASSNAFETVERESSSSRASRPTSRAQARIDAIVASTPPPDPTEQDENTIRYDLPVPPSGIRPAPHRKEYCTYWIRTGECDFIQQTCMYKHDMPDLPTLFRIGFRSVPAWWLEKEAREADEARLNARERTSNWVGRGGNRQLSVEGPVNRAKGRGKGNGGARANGNRGSGHDEGGPSKGNKSGANRNRKPSTVTNLIDLESLPEVASNSTALVVHPSARNARAPVLTPPSTSTTSAPKETGTWKSRKQVDPNTAGEPSDGNVSKGKGKGKERASGSPKKHDKPQASPQGTQMSAHQEQKSLMASVHASKAIEAAKSQDHSGPSTHAPKSIDFATREGRVTAASQAQQTIVVALPQGMMASKYAPKAIEGQFQ